MTLVPLLAVVEGDYRRVHLSALTCQEMTTRRAKEIEALLADRDIMIAQAVEQELITAAEAEAWKQWDEETRSA